MVAPLHLNSSFQGSHLLWPTESLKDWEDKTVWVLTILPRLSETGWHFPPSAVPLYKEMDRVHFQKFKKVKHLII